VQILLMRDRIHVQSAVISVSSLKNSVSLKKFQYVTLPWGSVPSFGGLVDISHWISA
jgi:hypothetical protein